MHTSLRDARDAAAVRRWLKNSKLSRSIKIYQRLVLAQYEHKLEKEDRLDPRLILAHDKFAFVMGAVGLQLCAYWLGCSPSTFHWLYSCFSLFLYSCRVYLYRKIAWHMFLFDFCYFANVLTLVAVWLRPLSPALVKVVFAFNLGPQAMAIVLMRNSMVFHSLDKITSLFLHLAPACVSWAFRWHHLPSREAGECAGHDCGLGWGDAGLREMVAVPSAAWLLWACPYYVKLFVVSRVEKSLNFYSWMTASPSGVRLMLINKVPPPLHPICFMLLHYLLCLAGFLSSYLWWRSELAGAAYIFGLMTWSAWNGANYFFEVFSRRYIENIGAEPWVKKAKVEIDQAAAEVEAAANEELAAAEKEAKRE